MDTEKCFEMLGGKNKWILKWFFIISLSKSLASVFSMFSFQFTATIPKQFHCSVPENQTITEFIPLEYHKGNWNYSRCLQFSNFTNSSTVPCQNGYDYRFDIITSSTVKEWNLVCHRSILNNMATSSFFVMSFFGSIISCTLSDRYGRKLVFLIAFTGLNLTELLIGILPNVYVHIVMRMAAGIFQQGCYVVGLTIIIELFSIKNRANACMIDTLIWSFACVILDVIAYFIRGIHWRYFYVITALFAYIPFLFLYWKLPKSIRWLMSQNKVQEAKSILKKIGKYSNPPVAVDAFDNLTETSLNKKIPIYNITHIFKTPLLLRYQLVHIFAWFSTALTFYGCQVKVVEIGNPFINFLLSILVEIPANICTFPLVNKFGRKLILIIFYNLNAFVLLMSCLFLIYIENEWWAISLLLIGKMVSTGIFNVVFMYIGEMFPTTLRSTSMGLCSSAARLGASVGAMIFQTGSDIPQNAFILVIGLNFASGFLVFCLPETYKWKMPNTITEIQEWTMGKRFFRLR